MKFLKVITGFVLVTAMLTACGSDDKKETENKEPAKEETVTVDNGSASKLEGAWEIMRAEGMAVKSNLGTVYTFKGDNLTMGKSGFDNQGKTEITDSTFSFQAEGNEYKFIYNYHFNSDTLVAEMQNSNGQILHMVKN